MVQQPKILLIDDDPLIRQFIVRILEPLYLVIQAENGIRGIELAKSVAPDVILLDVMMPGMDGYEVCQQLRSLEITSKTPIILLTALDQIDAKIHGLQVGADDYMTKPFDTRELQIRIQVQLRRQGTTTKELRIPLVVFLCHSSGDKPAVRDLYQQLRKDGFKPWLDEEDILPGKEWEQEIRNAVRHSDVVLVCLSKNAVQKSGFIQKEIRYALDVAEEQPENSIFIIPVRLDFCDVPERLRRWQWVDFFEQKGYERLLSALHERAKTVRREE